jgi:hypothetical protein
VGGDAHDRAGAVVGDHVAGHPHRQAGAGHRVQRVAAAEHPARLALAAGQRPLPLLGRERLHLGQAVRGHQRRQLGMLGRHRQERHPRQGVRPGGEGRQPPAALQLEVDLDPVGAADPLALQPLGRLRPVQRVEAVQQLVGVGGDAQEPLAHGPPGDPGAAALAAVALQLLVGEHRQARGAPDHRRRAPHGQALPVQPQEQPLRPAVVGRVAGDHLVAPVPPRPEPPELPAVALHGPSGQRGRVLADAQRVVLGVDAEGIEADRLEHLATPHAQPAPEGVGPRVGVGVADVEPLGGRVGELHQVVGLLAGRQPLQVELVQAVARPARLPAGLDLERVVPGHRMHLRKRRTPRHGREGFATAAASAAVAR